MQTVDPTLDLLQRCEALLQGHFLLSSGLHADRYFQCARAFVDPKVGDLLVGMLAGQLAGVPADVVVGPALGGVIVAYELARRLGTRTCFTERDGGTMQLRRGFAVPRGARVLVAEDVVTTGRSSAEVLNVLRSMGAEPVGVACLVDRSQGRAAHELGLPVWSLIQPEVPTWPADACPQCRAGIPVVKPGSRPQ